jgi:hypothetical protein
MLRWFFLRSILKRNEQVALYEACVFRVEYLETEAITGPYALDHLANARYLEVVMQGLVGKKTDNEWKRIRKSLIEAGKIKKWN